jgi:hypothetical protein
VREMPRKFYHFTAKEYVPSILATGLTKGDVPTGLTTGKNAVWLTTTSDPEGNGLYVGGMMTDEDRIIHHRLFGVMPPPGARYPNKLAVRITIDEVPDSSLLRRWKRWGPANCTPDMLDRLHRANGANHRTWWLYFGTIPPESFSSVELWKDGEWLTVVED